MRDLVIKEIKRNYYERGLDESRPKNKCVAAERLEKGEISFDEYVELLSDSELLLVLDSQHCQEYR